MNMAVIRVLNQILYEYIKYISNMRCESKFHISRVTRETIWNGASDRLAAYRTNFRTASAT